MYKTVDTDQFLGEFPQQYIQEKDLYQTMTRQVELFCNDRKFLKMLSINRYLSPSLLYLSIDKSLNLLKTLYEQGFNIQLNELGNPFLEHEESYLDLEQFESTIKERFQLESITSLSSYFITQLVAGNDIRELKIFPEPTDNCDTIGDLLAGYCLGGNGLSIGDMPSLNLVLFTQICLLRHHLVKENISRLLRDDNMLHDIDEIF